MTASLWLIRHTLGAMTVELGAGSHPTNPPCQHGPIGKLTAPGCRGVLQRVARGEQQPCGEASETGRFTPNRSQIYEVFGERKTRQRLPGRFKARREPEFSLFFACGRAMRLLVRELPGWVEVTALLPPALLGQGRPQKSSVQEAGTLCTGTTTLSTGGCRSGQAQNKPPELSLCQRQRAPGNPPAKRLC